MAKIPSRVLQTSVDTVINFATILVTHNDPEDTALLYQPNLVLWFALSVLKTSLKMAPISPC